MVPVKCGEGLPGLRTFFAMTNTAEWPKTINNRPQESPESAQGRA